MQEDGINGYHFSVYLTFPAEISATLLTGSARVTGFGRDISKLLNQRAEKFAWLQPVLAGPLSTAGVWRNV